MLSSARKADYEQSIAYPADLQVKQLTAGMVPSFIGWWKDGSMNDVLGVPEHVSLLFEYARKDRFIYFFLEPGEAYEFEPAFYLPPGDYAAKVVFGRPARHRRRILEPHRLLSGDVGGSHRREGRR